MVVLIMIIFAWLFDQLTDIVGHSDGVAKLAASGFADERSDTCGFNSQVIEPVAKLGII